MRYIKYILILIAILTSFSSMVQVNAQTTGTCTWQYEGNPRIFTETRSESACKSEARNAPVSLSWTPPGGTTKSIIPDESNPVGYCTGGNTGGTTYRLTQDNCTKTWKGSWSATPPTTNPAPVPCTSRAADGTFLPAGCKGAPPPANTIYKLLAPLPCPPGSTTCDSSKGLTEIDTTKRFGSYLNIMIKIFIGLCAVLSVVMIVMGGIEYMTSELVHSKEAGKERIMHAILGLLIALGAYALLFTINPDLLKSDINVPDVKVATGKCTVVDSTGNDGWSTRTAYHQNKTQAECNALKPADGTATWEANTISPVAPTVTPATPTKECTPPQVKRLTDGECVTPAITPEPVRPEDDPNNQGL